MASRAHALTTNTALISAIANDLSYGDVFAYQIESFARPGDVVMVVSSSGDSENIVRAIDTAKKLGLDTIALTGFDGGRARRIANVAIHVESDNYGIIEDTHQSVMHIIAQYIRQRDMDDDGVLATRF